MTDFAVPVVDTPDLAGIRREVEKVRRLSDKLVSVGPVGIGLDGLITWIPGAGLLYTLGAGGYLIHLARKAGAPRPVITRMLTWLALDTLTSEIPLVGDAVDLFYRGHAKAASTLLGWLDNVELKPARTRAGRRADGTITTRR